MTEITTDNHPVKIGVSDAYYVDATVSGQYLGHYTEAADFCLPLLYKIYSAYFFAFFCRKSSFYFSFLESKKLYISIFSILVY